MILSAGLNVCTEHACASESLQSKYIAGLLTKWKKDVILECIGLGVRVMVFNTTFNNTSVISWQSVLLVEENRVSLLLECILFFILQMP